MYDLMNYSHLLSVRVRDVIAIATHQAILSKVMIVVESLERLQLMMDTGSDSDRCVCVCVHCVCALCVCVRVRACV